MQREDILHLGESELKAMADGHLHLGHDAMMMWVASGRQSAEALELMSEHNKARELCLALLKERQTAGPS